MFQKKVPACETVHTFPVFSRSNLTVNSDLLSAASRRRHGPRRPRRACQRVRTGQGGGRHTRSTSYGIRARHLRQTRKTRCTHPLLERLTARWGRRATWWCDRIGVENVRHRWFDAPRGRARYPPPSTTPTSMHRSFSITRSNTTSSFRNCL